MKDKIELSIIIPTFNESNNISIIVTHLIKVLEKYKYEIIIVDDNSDDNTWKVVDEKFKTHPNIYCFRRIRHKGLSSAIVDGFMLSKGENLVVVDADLQHDVNVIPKMLKKIKENYDIVIGSRYTNNKKVEDWNFFRRSLSLLGTKMSYLIQDSLTTDPLSGFFLIKKKVFLSVVNSMDIKGYKILLDILASLNKNYNYKIIDIPYEFQERKYGKSKLDGQVLLESIELIYSKLFGNFIPVNFAKFITVGSFGALLHFTILFFLFKYFRYSYSISLITSIEISIFFNYFFNNIWTFRFSTILGFENLKGILKFNILSGIGGLIAYLISINLFNLGFNWILSSFLGAFVASLWNYNLNRILTWKAI